MKFFILLSHHQICHQYLFIVRKGLRKVRNIAHNTAHNIAHKGHKGRIIQRHHKEGVLASNTKEKQKTKNIKEKQSRNSRLTSNVNVHPPRLHSKVPPKSLPVTHLLEK